MLETQINSLKHREKLGGVWVFYTGVYTLCRILGHEIYFFHPMHRYLSLQHSWQNLAKNFVCKGKYILVSQQV